MANIINTYNSYPASEDLNPIPQAGLLVDLNAATMFTTGDVLAVENDPITNWGNSVSGNSISGAVQEDGAKQPILKVTLNGTKEVDFGNDSVSRYLSLGTPTELDWSNNAANYTVIMQSGDGNGSIYWISSIIDEDNSTGFALDYFNGYGNKLWATFGASWLGSNSTPMPTTSTVLSATRTAGGRAKVLVNNAVILNSSSGTVTYTTRYPLWIGSSMGSESTHNYKGTFRRVLIWDRVLTDEELTDVYNELIS